MSCPICEKRPPKRFCPAKGEKICAICCGREREVSIDCPSDCPHLIAGRRYEAEHRKPLPAQDFPYRDVQFPVDFVYERWHAVSVLANAILGFQMQNRELNDAGVQSALEALAETYRTLGTGIYYERPPAAPLPRALYGLLAESLQNQRKQEAESTGGLSSLLKESDLFRLLVFLLRIAREETNGRPRSRAFLDFLRSRFPLPADAPKEASRIILP
ncbi:MAG: hypothetical protein ACRD4C_07585 [Candidatus Acidiferrales bacterium]